jgi:hypothetical protein
MTPQMPPPPMMMPQQPPPPQKKGMSGCMIAFIVVSIIGVLGALVVGIVVYLVATSSAGKTAIKLVGESTELAQKGMTAPGTAELRALGCEQAMVLDMKDVGNMMNDVLDAGLGDASISGLMVQCTIARNHSAAISCDDAASTYVRAIGGTASDEFVVTVQRHGDSRKLCESSYDATGKLVGSGSSTHTGTRGTGI